MLYLTAYGTQTNGRAYSAWILAARQVSFLILLLSVIALVPAAFAGQPEATISDIVLTNTRDDLLLYFTVKNCFTPSINKAIENGIPTTFTFVVKLYETRSLWPDRRITKLRFKHEIAYDSLKRIYTINLSEREKGTVKVKDFRTAKRLMAEVDALRLTSLKNLKKGAHYQVKMMAELEKTRLPFHLHSILFFLSLWDFKTDWYTLDFRY